MPYDEADLLPISALQHLAFCERQCALIHLEQVWLENRLTVEGRHLHDKAHEPRTELIEGVLVARALRLRSLQLGLSGVADVVEFQPVEFAAGEVAEAGAEGAAVPAGIALPGRRGRWLSYPVEYKRGRPKSGTWDEVQLCAQAMCLEEMLGVAIPSAALYYGQPRRRHSVALTPALRGQVEASAARLHALMSAGVTPPARYEKKCDACSLLPVCMPKTAGAQRSAARYLEREMVAESGGDAHG